MNTSKIAVRYAKALFLLAKDKELLAEIGADMVQFFNALSENQVIMNLLESPAIKPSEKRKLVSSLFENTLHEHTMSFIYMVLKNKREKYFLDIARHFIKLHREHNRIKYATIKSAKTLGESVKIRIVELIKSNFNIKEVVLNEEVDKELIGGIVLRIDDIQIDASVATKLKTIEKELTDKNIKTIGL